MASKEAGGPGPDKYARNKSKHMKLSFEIGEEKILLVTFRQRSYYFWRHSVDLVKFAAVP